MFYREDFIKEVLELYAAGVAVLDISNFTGSTVAVVNEVIDNYIAHM